MSLAFRVSVILVYNYLISIGECTCERQSSGIQHSFLALARFGKGQKTIYHCIRVHGYGQVEGSDEGCMSVGCLQGLALGCLHSPAALCLFRSRMLGIVLSIAVVK